jgi:hypothetical protein
MCTAKGRYGARTTGTGAGPSKWARCDRYEIVFRGEAAPLGWHQLRDNISGVDYLKEVAARYAEDKHVDVGAAYVFGNPRHEMRKEVGEIFSSRKFVAPL